MREKEKTKRCRRSRSWYVLIYRVRVVWEKKNNLVQQETKATQMRTEGGHLFKACYSKDVRHHQECLADSKAGRREGKFYDEKREGFRCAFIRGCWHGEAGSELTRSGVSCVADFGNHIQFSLIGPELEVGKKKKLGKLSITAHVLGILS